MSSLPASTEYLIVFKIAGSLSSCLPFPKHWLAYLALKIIVLALAIYLVLRHSEAL